MPDDPKRNHEAETAGGERDEICSPVTLKAVNAGTRAILINDRMGVEDRTIK